MSIVDKLLDAEGAIQTEARVPDLDRLLHEAASEIETLAAVNAELLEALEEIAALRERAVFDYIGPVKTMPGSPYDRGYAKALEEVRSTARAAIAKAKGDGHA